VQVHLVDATYELFRSWFALPPIQSPGGQEVAATYGLMRQMLVLLREGATHIGCATDSVVRSFRNDLYAGYKTDEGVAPKLLAQFPLAEEGLRALGVAVWPMIDFEADDALATGAVRFKADPRVSKIFLCTVDKDLAQVIDGTKVVMNKRKDKIIIDEDGVREKWGVSPGSIADWLALVGDAADGYPGLPGWGEKSAAMVLAAYGTIEKIPDEYAEWKVKPRGGDKLAATLKSKRADAMLFKKLATLRTDCPISATVDEIEWKGARPELRDFCKRMGFESIPEKIERWIEPV
jgi:5'-3' exonuclease